MKKIIIYVVVIIGTIFSCGITSLAGDIPERLIRDDKAMLFFGRVLSYDAKKDTITVIPTKKIKGDVKVGIEQIYQKGVNPIRFTPMIGKIYLISYNSQLHLFRTTSTNTKTLKLKDANGDNLLSRMQKYLNAGTYKKAEKKRLAKIKKQSSKLEPTLVPTVPPTITPTQESITDNKKESYGLIGGVVFVGIIVSLFSYLKRRKK